MPACDLRLEIALGLQILSYLAQLIDSLQLQALHVLAELVMQAIDPPTPLLSCLESFYEAS
jgi:hypothetical protein